MIFFTLFGWLGLALLCILFILSMAAGLFYLAEIIEEYTVLAGKIIGYLNSFVLGVIVCFFIFEDVPTYLLAISFVSHINHIFILQRFPFFNVSSPSFIAFLVLLTLNHYFTFQFFSSVYYNFLQVLSYFTVCLWLIPFSFFVSLSANDNVLPTSVYSRNDDDFVSSYLSRKGHKSGLLSLFNYAKESILPQRVKKAF